MKKLFLAILASLVVIGCGQIGNSSSTTTSDNNTFPNTVVERAISPWGPPAVSPTPTPSPTANPSPWPNAWPVRAAPPSPSPSATPQIFTGYTVATLNQALGAANPSALVYARQSSGYMRFGDVTGSHVAASYYPNNWAVTYSLVSPPGHSFPSNFPCYAEDPAPALPAITVSALQASLVGAPLNDVVRVTDQVSGFNGVQVWVTVNADGSVTINWTS